MEEPHIINEADSLDASQPKCIHEIDLNGCLISMNEVGLKMLGLSDENDIKGIPYLNAVSDADQARIRTLFDQALAGEASTFQFRGSGRNASHYFSSCFVPVKNEDGKVARVIGVTREVTKLVNANTMMLVKNKAFDNVNQGILITDPLQPDNPVIYINKTLKRITGYVDEEVLGRNCRFLQGPDTDPITRKKLRQAIKSGSDHHCEILNYRKNGTPFWNELTITAVKDGDGNLINFIGLLNDITKRKKVERELKKLGIAIEQSPASVVMTDLEGKITYVNPKFEEVTGFAAHKVIGKNPRLLKSGHTSKEEYKELWDTITSGKTWHGEFHNRKRDGTFYWEKASIAPIVNEKGVVTEYLAIKEDITDIKETQRVLKETLVHMEDLVEERTLELKLAKEDLERTHQSFMDSLNYAKRIQKASLPSEIDFKKAFEQHFCLFLPRDIVSGDFYWLYRNGNHVVLAVADCTGHGVPGALMSMAGHEQLSHIIIREGIQRPDAILEELDQAMGRLLQRKNSNHVLNDGMDISVVHIDYDNYVFEFSGAQSHGIFIRKNDVMDLAPTRAGIGGLESGHFKKFELQRFPFAPGDKFYLFSDGFYDQFGGATGKKMLRKNFIKLLVDGAQEDMVKQGEFLKQAFSDWLGDHDQIDDVTVVGAEL